MYNINSIVFHYLMNKNCYVFEILTCSMCLTLSMDQKIIMQCFIYQYLLGTGSSWLLKICIKPEIIIFR